MQPKGGANPSRIERYGGEATRPVSRTKVTIKVLRIIKHMNQMHYAHLDKNLI